MYQQRHLDFSYQLPIKFYIELQFAILMMINGRLEYHVIYFIQSGTGAPPATTSNPGGSTNSPPSGGLAECSELIWALKLTLNLHFSPEIILT